MKSNRNDEVGRAQREYEEAMRQPCPVVRPRMVAIEFDKEMSRAIQMRPEKLVIRCEDERGVLQVRRPYVNGAATVLLSAGKNLDVYAMVRR